MLHKSLNSVLTIQLQGFHGYFLFGSKVRGKNMLFRNILRTCSNEWQRMRTIEQSMAQFFVSRLFWGGSRIGRILSGAIFIFYYLGNENKYVVLISKWDIFGLWILQVSWNSTPSSGNENNDMCKQTNEQRNASLPRKNKIIKF